MKHRDNVKPYPCANFLSPDHDCTCTPPQIQKYMSRISGPLLDRIDIHLEVPAVRYADLSSDRTGEPSAVIQERVKAAREIQNNRFETEQNIYCNAHMQSNEIRKYCKIDEYGRELLKNAITKLGLSARAYDRILKVSRTIADLAGSDKILPEFVAEAIQYRSLDRRILK